MVSTKWFQGINKLEDVLLVRNKVFLDEQNIDEKLITDEYDQISFNVVVYENNLPVGTGRLIFKNNQYQIGRIAVISEFRGKRYGDLIVRMLIRKAINLGAEEVYLHSQANKKSFYEEIGFKAYGVPYKEAGIEHISMVRRGDVGGDCC